MSLQLVVNLLLPLVDILSVLITLERDLTDLYNANR